MRNLTSSMNRRLDLATEDSDTDYYNTEEDEEEDHRNSTGRQGRTPPSI